MRLISLQKQAAAADREVPFGAQIERPLDANDVGPEALLDTAALMANLDLVVSIDSMPAHLAGALGRPVFLALPLVPDWRWLPDREDSPGIRACGCSARTRPGLAGGVRAHRGGVRETVANRA